MKNWFWSQLDHWQFYIIIFDVEPESIAAISQLRSKPSLF